MTHPQVALGEIATLIRGITYKPSDVCEATTLSAVACMRTKNVQEDLDESDIVWIPASIIRNSSKYLNPGDILVSSANSWNLVGKGCWVPELKYPASAGGFISILRGNPDTVDLRYLYHWFISPQTQAKLRSYSNKTTNISNLDHSRTLATEIPLPPLEEQRRIAAILDKAESIESLAVKRSIVWPKLARSLFYEMFGGVNSNPFKYPVTALGDLLSNAEIFRDGDWVESKDQDPAGDVRLIQLADVGDGFYVDKSSRYLTYDTSIRLRCTHLKRGDILVARMPDPLCRACIFPGDSKISVTVVDVCIIRVDPAAADPIWLTWMINSPEFRSNAISSATGSTRSRVSRGNLSKLPVLLPPLAAQKHFGLTLSKAMSLFGHENFSCSSKSFHRIRRIAAALRDEVFCSQK